MLFQVIIGYQSKIYESTSDFEREFWFCLYEKGLMTTKLPIYHFFPLTFRQHIGL